MSTMEALQRAHAAQDRAAMMALLAPDCVVLDGRGEAAVHGAERVVDALQTQLPWAFAWVQPRPPHGGWQHALFREADQPGTVRGDLRIASVDDGPISAIELRVLPQSSVPVPRTSIRGLVVAPGPQLLLIGMRSWRGGWWLTPGGGMEAGETRDDALRRELAEEAGLHEFKAGPWVWSRSATYLGRTKVIVQAEFYAWVEVPAPFEPQATEPDPGTEQYRWWSSDELRTTKERLVPTQLGALWAALVGHGLPAEPLQVGF